MARAPREAFPWREAMAFGIGRLRLAPDLFWSLTPAELLLMAEAGRPAAKALDRAALDALIARHDRHQP